MARHLLVPLVAGALASILSLPVAALADATTLRPPAQGGVVVVDRAAYVAYVADADNAALHRLDLISGDVVSMPLACAPEQVALLGGSESGATRVALALRGCNQGAVVQVGANGEGRVEASVEVPGGGGWVEASVEVPVEPWGLAVTPRGEVLVTSAWGHALTGADAETLATRFTVDLAREARSVVITRDGRRAFVTHAVGDAVTAVELVPSGSGEGQAEVKRIFGLSPRYRNAVDLAIGAHTAQPTTSLAFAAALSESGSRLFVPHLAVQNGQEAVSLTPGGDGGGAVEEDASVASVGVLGVESGEWVVPPTPKSPDPPFLGTVAPAGAACRQPTAASVLGDTLYVTSYGTGDRAPRRARAPRACPRPARRVRAWRARRSGAPGTRRLHVGGAREGAVPVRQRRLRWLPRPRSGHERPPAPRHRLAVEARRRGVLPHAAAALRRRDGAVLPRRPVPGAGGPARRQSRPHGLDEPA